MKLNLIGALLLAAMAFGQPATAHEELIGSSPEAGETVEAGVIEIDLEFTNDLLDLGSGAELVVRDDAQNFVPASCLAVSGTHALSIVDIDQPGEYTVGWRVVSGDGHPIEGSFNFFVENSDGYVAKGIAEPCLIAQSEEVEMPQFSYWLLFGSLGLIAAGLFFYLRPRKKDSGE